MTAPEPPNPEANPPEEPTREPRCDDGSTSSPEEAAFPKLSSLFGEVLRHARLEPTLEDQPPQRYAADPDCPQCHGHGYLTRPVPRGDPEFGKAVPCPCSEAMLRERRLTRLFGKARIPREYERLSFATYALQPQGDQEARALVQDWADRGHGSLFLWGPVGRGKTGLALCALRHRVGVQEVDALYRYVPELFAEIRRGFDRELGGLTSGEIEQAFRETGLLLLDDLGKERLTPWVLEAFNQLIDYRWREHRPTIFTSNYPLEALRDRLGEAFHSRVRAMCWPNVIEIHGTDLRDQS